MLFKKTGYFLLYIGEYYKWFLLKVCNFEELNITYQGNFNIYSTQKNVTEVQSTKLIVITSWCMDKHLIFIQADKCIKNFLERVSINMFRMI